MSGGEVDLLAALQRSLDAARSQRVTDRQVESRTHTDHTAAAQQLLDVRDETAQRLSRLTSVERTRALAWLAMQQPDVLNEALDETGAQR